MLKSTTEHIDNYYIRCNVYNKSHMCNVLVCGHYMNNTYSCSKIKQ